MRKAFLDPLPRGYALEEQEWQRRHRLLLTLLTGHIPALAVVGGLLGRDIGALLAAITVPAVCAGLGVLLRHRRRAAAITVTLGLVYCSTALVGLTGGAIEAHFHFFVIIGFIALYQDWTLFLFMILFTTASHVVGSYWQRDLIFSHAAGQANPWLWSLVHGVAVLVACIGILLLWHLTDDVQEKIIVARREADAEVGQRRFTHDLLVNLARRNQSMLYRQLEIINRLEESERDPDTLGELFALDHLATRVRRNAESLLVLSGEQPQRVWTHPVPLRDVLRAAIAETEDLNRVVFVADEELAVAGHTVTDLTHLIAELTENAVRFSPPDSTVSIRANPNPQVSGGYAITVEDWGVGMPAERLAAANELLARPSDVDLSVAHRLGLHVVARLAARHYIVVSLNATPNSGVTATVLLPPTLFTGPAYDITEPVPQQRPVLDDPPGAGPAPAARRPAVAREPGPRHREPVAPATAVPVAEVPVVAVPVAPRPAARVSSIGFPVMGVHDCPAPVIRNGTVVAGSNGHHVAAPADRVPAVEVPAVEVPAVEVPAVEVPAIEVPPIEVPAVQARTVEMPTVTVPAVEKAAAARAGAPEPPPAPAPPPAPEPVVTAEERWPGWWAPEIEGTLPEPAGYEPNRIGSAPPEPTLPPIPTPAPTPIPTPTTDLVPSPRPRTAAVSQLPPQSDRRSVETPEPQPVEVPVDQLSGLRRRIPQTHLAPGLRQSRDAPEPPDPRASPEHGTEAAHALSRYQASRQAARTAVEDGQRWGR